ncbi:regulatory cyclin phoB [Aspergillus ibericus CBS 121593]|uniref:Cyclin-domain-containing protein n=1 Tax=Aspergillus ibericus CBS 121593 TaxID=1448316 RepID=A0A395HBS0_9EURO|nr:cyclin-domain-containing protein [Aspergillus ibericus CBS 121593]RAL04953.1 cyclin-domain-containing protein [Aspergillus ibericus CBS 121593]
MLVSSPSPSAALRPSPSSPSIAHSHHSHSHSRSHSHPQPPLPSSSSSSSSPFASIPRHPSHQHYEPPGPASAAAASNPRFEPQSSRAAIEELRSALNRHTVGSSPPGPSGDFPRGRMSAGLTSSGGGSSTTSHPPADAAIPASNPTHPPLDRPTNNVSASAVPAASVPAPSSQPTSTSPMPAPNSAGSGSNKRNSPNDAPAGDERAAGLGHADLEGSQTKRMRPDKPEVKLLPQRYELADPRDIVVLISSMLMELIRFNDKIPLNQGRLTRFHSRSPPRISVQDYLQRLTTHATLSPPILLSMVYYIDRLCALYPAFTVSSLTIHRFLIASATVASKGLSDSFWTNKTYARVGGITMTELALLELEFLFRVEWRIVPEPEVLVDYYKSLAERCDGYAIARDS